MAKHRITTRKKLEIVEETIRLLRKPASWCKGKWQCEVGEDRNGDPIYAFCLDGAIGQATVNVLGRERAEKLGVDFDGYGLIADGGEVGELLSVRKLAFDALVEHGYFADVSYEVEDDGDTYQITLNDHSKTTHKDVLALLRKKARQLRAALKRVDARREGA